MVAAKKKGDKKRTARSAASEEGSTTKKRAKVVQDSKSTSSGSQVLIGRVAGKTEKDGGARTSFGNLAFVWIHLSQSERAILWQTEVSDVEAWESHPFKSLKPGSFVKCVKVKKPASSKHSSMDNEHVSMRPSLIEAASRGELDESFLDHELEQSSSFPQVGELVKGFVEHADNKKGAIVRISRSISAIVPASHLADHFVKEITKDFPTGKLVVGRVLTSDASQEKLALSLRSSDVVGENSSSKFSWQTLEPGMHLDGTVQNIADFGLFISLREAPHIKGLCYYKELVDGEASKELLRDYSRGDQVRVHVLSVDSEKKKLALSLKPSHFEDEAMGQKSSGQDVDESEDESSEEENEEDGLVSSSKLLEQLSDSSDDEALEKMKDDDSDDSESDQEVENDEKEVDDEDMNESEQESDNSDEESEEKGDSPTKGGALSLQDALKKTAGKGQTWDIVNPASTAAEDGSDSSDSDSENDSEGGGEPGSKSKKKSSKARAKQRKLEEAEIVAKEQARLQDDQAPQSVDDYERLLLGMPNSSLLWIQYMAFQTAQTEIDQARAIGERALRTINFREEGEKQNVWFALMELEYKFGSSKSVEDVIKRMLPEMEKKHAYIRVAEMYQSGGEYDKADDALRKAVKAKKGETKKGWIKRIELKFEQSDPEGAKALLHAAIKSLPEKKHMFVYLTFARLEYSLGEKGGSKERARTMCEELVGRAPKRNDLWHQYIDLEIKFGGGDRQRVRELFERTTSVKFSVKKMKALFKKWLTYESEHGTPEGVADVKARAAAYVRSLTEAS